jgi:Nif-specific regulatory protein
MAAKDRPALDTASVLVSVSESFGAPVPLGGLLNRALAAVVRAVEADRGSVFLLERASGELVSVAGEHPEVAELRVPLGVGIVGHVARTGTVVRAERARDDARFESSVDRRTGYSTRSVLAAPMRDDDGAIVGVVELLNKRTAFTEDDELLLRGLAAQFAEVVARTSIGTRLDARSDGDGRGAILPRYNGIVGQSPALASALDTIGKAARSDATVLLVGETGTGKSALARALHLDSRRRTGPFVALDCAALPGSLLENELFGHERGAFTGADRRVEGRIEQASGGTLLLDEIGELPLSAQAKLLGVLQERTLTRLGGGRPVKVDVRIVAATHRDLEEMVVRGRFRQDLFYRLRVVTVRVPSLRERGRGDVLALAEHFAAHYAARNGKGRIELSDAAKTRLAAYAWPGNVRELEHCVEGAVVLADGPVIELEHLALPPVAGAAPTAPTSLRASIARLRWDELERIYLEAVLAAHDGNRSAAARAAGWGRATLLRKIAALEAERAAGSRRAGSKRGGAIEG